MTRNEANAYLAIMLETIVECPNGAPEGPMFAAREARVVAGVDALGPHLVPDYDTETGEGHREFSRIGCDACGSRLAGEMHRFAVLGEEKTGS